MPFIYYIYLLYYFVSQLLVWQKMDKKRILYTFSS